jgi:hypothetical protein
MLGIRKENAMWEVMVQLKRIDSYVDGHFFDKSHHEGVCANGGLAPDIYTQRWYQMYYVLATLTQLPIK